MTADTHARRLSPPRLHDMCGRAKLTDIERVARPSWWKSLCIAPLPFSARVTAGLDQPLDILQLKTDTSWWVSVAPHLGHVGACSFNKSCSDIGRWTSNRAPHVAHSNS